MPDLVRANKRRAALLVVTFVVLVVGLGWGLGLAFEQGLAGVAGAGAVAVIAIAVAWWRSDAIALAMSHARPASEVDHARFHNLVEGLCIASGLPKPRLYVVDDPAPNAFATGRNPRHAAVAVTSGLLDGLNRVELEGVLAHELSHVKHYDTRVSTLAVTLVGGPAVLCDLALRLVRRGGPRHRDDRRAGPGVAAILGAPGLVLLAVAPLVGRLVRIAVSRRRESLADLSGVALTRYPPGLISALEKLRNDTTVVHSGARSTAHLWIGFPVPGTGAAGREAWLNRFFDANPSLDERIGALREL